MARSRIRKVRSLHAALAAGALIGLTLFAHTADAKKTKVLDLEFDGEYEMDFLTLELSFEGDSQCKPLANSDIEGVSLLAPSASPSCFDLVEDSVTITTANGSTITIENTGTDCLDDSTGELRIVGQGKSQITGGTGKFAGVTGKGVYDVDAPVTAMHETGASGTFNLHFSLKINK